MKIIILMENTCIDPSYEKEHGLSVYVETEKHKLLVDAGQTSKTWQNAKTAGIDLTKIDMLALSHGHYDHSGGIVSFTEVNPTAPIYLQKTALEDYYHGERYIGIDEAIKTLPTLHFVDSYLEIDEEISIFSEIKGRILWPKSNLVLSKKRNDTLLQDEFDHEQCVVIKDAKSSKTVLISGCAHNGILNILDRYNAIYGTVPDYVISGFHMMKKTEYTPEEISDIQNTAHELNNLPTIFYSGHCTSQAAMDLMKPIMGDKLVQISSGMNISL